MHRPHPTRPSNLSAMFLIDPSQLEARGKDAIDIIHVLSLPGHRVGQSWDGRQCVNGTFPAKEEFLGYADPFLFFKETQFLLSRVSEQDF